MPKRGQPEKSSQQRLAETLGLTTRQVRNLTDDGVFSRRIKGGKPEYDIPACVQAYLKYKIDREAGGEGKQAKDRIVGLSAQKLEIEVQVAELALQQQRGQLVTLDYMEAQIRGLLEALRARCLNLPGKYAREFADAPDPPSALIVLERLSTELLQALSEAGEDPELDEHEEDDEGGGRDANDDASEDAQ